MSINNKKKAKLKLELKRKKIPSMKEMLEKDERFKYVLIGMVIFWLIVMGVILTNVY